MWNLWNTRMMSTRSDTSIWPKGRTRQFRFAWVQRCSLRVTRAQGASDTVDCVGRKRSREYAARSLSWSSVAAAAAAGGGKQHAPLCDRLARDNSNRNWLCVDMQRDSAWPKLIGSVQHLWTCRQVMRTSQSTLIESNEVWTFRNAVVR